MAGIAARGALPTCDGVLSGYMGSAETGAAILDAVATVKAVNPHALWCCDPVIGDVGRGVFVRPGIPEFIRDHALPAADIVTPNQFELENLTGFEVRDAAGARAAVAALQARGPSVVLVTSLHLDDTPPDMIDMAAAANGQLFRLRTPKLDVTVNGAGDAIAALFFVHFLARRSAAEALAKAGASVYGLLRRTAEAGSREILTVAAQEEFVNPSSVFPVSAL
jgi:pyridoxine kinase